MRCFPYAWNCARIRSPAPGLLRATTFPTMRRARNHFAGSVLTPGSRRSSSPACPERPALRGRRAPSSIPPPCTTSRARPPAAATAFTTACARSARTKYWWKTPRTTDIYGRQAMPRSNSSCCWPRSVFRILKATDASSTSASSRTTEPVPDRSSSILLRS